LPDHLPRLLSIPPLVHKYKTRNLIHIFRRAAKPKKVHSGWLIAHGHEAQNNNYTLSHPRTLSRHSLPRTVPVPCHTHDRNCGSLSEFGMRSQANCVWAYAYACAWYIRTLVRKKCQHLDALPVQGFGASKPTAAFFSLISEAKWDRDRDALTGPHLTSAYWGGFRY